MSFAVGIGHRRTGLQILGGGGGGADVSPLGGSGEILKSRVS